MLYTPLAKCRSTIKALIDSGVRVQKGDDDLKQAAIALQQQRVARMTYSLFLSDYMRTQIETIESLLRRFLKEYMGQSRDEIKEIYGSYDIEHQFKRVERSFYERMTPYQRA